MTRSNLLLQRFAVLTLLASLGCTLSCSSGATSISTTPPRVFTLTTGTETPVLTTSQRAALGLQFGPPDGTIGALLNAGAYTFFMPARSAATGCAGTPSTEGTYRFSGTLNAITSSNGCIAEVQPAATDPNGYTFDHDYAGGGPVLAVTSTTGQAGILHIYHGEYHAGTCSGLGQCFYASLGMAFSTDGGVTFRKLGEIIQPYVTRSSILGANLNLDIGGGTVVLADGSGQHIANLATADPANVYLYVFYPDRDPNASTVAPCNTRSCITVARALLSTVVADAFAGNTAAFPTLFKKYYNGAFTEPATSGDPNAATNSGHYTPIISTAANFPTVLWDTATQQYLIGYNTGNNAVALEHGSTLFSWSGQIPSGAITYGTDGIVYTTLIGEGSDPSTSNGHPWLFYVHASQPWPDWPDATVVNRQLTLSLQ